MHNEPGKFNILIENGMSIQNEQPEIDPFNQFSPLEIACVFKHTFFVKKLIDLGAKIDASQYQSILPLMINTPFFPQYNIFEERDLYQICVLLIKYGINLNAIRNRICNTYLETRRLLQISKLHSENSYQQSHRVHNKIIQLMNDAILLNIAIKKANIPAERTSIIRSLFFDFYWGAKQLDHIASKNFTLENLNYFKNFINNTSNIKETGKLLVRVLSLDVCFIIPRTNLSYISLKSFNQYLKNYHKIRRLTNRSLSNLNKLSDKIILNTNPNIFRYICSFLDAPSLKKPKLNKHKVIATIFYII